MIIITLYAIAAGCPLLSLPFDNSSHNNNNNNRLNRMRMQITCGSPNILTKLKHHLCICIVWHLHLMCVFVHVMCVHPALRTHTQTPYTHILFIL